MRVVLVDREVVSDMRLRRATYRGSQWISPGPRLRREGYEPSSSAHGDGPHARPAVDCSRPTLAKGVRVLTGRARRPPRPAAMWAANERARAAHGQLWRAL